MHTRIAQAKVKHVYIALQTMYTCMQEAMSILILYVKHISS